MSSHFMRDDFPFWIMRVLHDCDNAPEVHGHEFIELIYVVRGEAQHVFEGALYDIRAGDVFIINPGEVHTFRILPGKRIEIINCLFLHRLLPDAWLLGLDTPQSMDYFYIHPFLCREERFHHRLNLRGQDAVRVLSLLESMLREVHAQSPGCLTLIRLQMIELLVLLSRYYGTRLEERSVTAASDRAMDVLRMCGYLERNYHQKITLPYLAELFNVSVRQLNRMFRQETGCSVIERLHQIRIEKAKTLLEGTHQKVLSVAALVGYDDPAFFSRLFARQVGCAPGQYRDRAVLQGEAREG